MVIFVENLPDPTDLVTAADYRTGRDDPPGDHRELPVPLHALGLPSVLPRPASARVFLLD